MAFKSAHDFRVHTTKKNNVSDFYVVSLLFSTFPHNSRSFIEIDGKFLQQLQLSHK